MIIDATEPKSAYLRRMEEFYKARANKCHKRDLHVRIKEMYTHMRETELKKEEEQFKQHEEVLKKWDQ
jgi:hypothetical protein